MKTFSIGLFIVAALAAASSTATAPYERATGPQASQNSRNDPIGEEPLSKYFPDVRTEEGMLSAANGGFWAAIAFSVSIFLGLLFLLFAGRLPGIEQGTVQDFPFQILGVVIELIIVFAAAWRFKAGKGLVIGSFVTLVFAIELIQKVISGTLKIGWIFFFGAVALGLINGVRGAHARRTLSRKTI